MFKSCGYAVVVSDLATDFTKTIALFDYKDQATDYAFECNLASRRYFYSVKESK